MMMRKIGFLMMVMALFSSVAWAEDYVAMVMDVDDQAVRFTEGDPVEIMAFLEENDVIQVNDGAKVVILFFESSIREEIIGPVTITIGVSGSVSSSGRSTKIRRHSVDYLPPKARLDKSHHQNFGNIAFRKLGPSVDSGTQLIITSTLNAVYVPDARPVLTWKVYPKADLFTLTVSGDYGTDISETKSPSMNMATDILKPGRYTWVLEAKHRGKVVATRKGWFSIMTNATYESMKKSRDMILDEYPAGSMQEMAVLAMLYQSYDMWNEMSLVLLALHDKQPNNTEIIRKIGSINPHLLERAGR